MKSDGGEILIYLCVDYVCAGGAGVRHGSPEMPQAEARGGTRPVVGRGLGWLECAGGEEVCRGSSWSFHKPSRAAEEERSLVEAGIEVGVLVEGRRGMGDPSGDTPTGCTCRWHGAA